MMCCRVSKENRCILKERERESRVDRVVGEVESRRVGS